MAFIRLSYILDSNAPSYGNLTHPSLSRVSDIEKGASSNKTSIGIDSHTGTHIDFPLHFLADGKAGEQYQPREFVFENVVIAEINHDGGLITVEDLSRIKPSDSTELLLIKTGFCLRRKEEAYWQSNPGFGADTAAFLKKVFPSLRTIGFDSISLSSFQHREEGRKAHREFLSHNILIIEDMDLRNVNEQTKLARLFIAPLLFTSCDGAPCYILAETKD